MEFVYKAIAKAAAPNAAKLIPIFVAAPLLAGPDGVADGDVPVLDAFVELLEVELVPSPMASVTLATPGSIDFE